MEAEQLGIWFTMSGFVADDCGRRSWQMIVAEGRGRRSWQVVVAEDHGISLQALDKNPLAEHSRVQGLMAPYRKGHHYNRWQRLWQQAPGTGSCGGRAVRCTGMYVLVGACKVCGGCMCE